MDDETKGETNMDDKRIYAALTALDAYVSDMIYVMDNTDRSDKDGIADTRRDLLIRIENSEGQLKRLREVITDEQ